jgi:SAM-dependent methyltransferase
MGQCGCGPAPDDMDRLSGYYDLRHGRYQEDIAFYQGLAARTGGVVLELGCGRGRLLAHLAAEGATVVGLDISAGMLAAAAKVAAPLAKVHLLRASLDALPVRGAGLAIMALNTFCHFGSPAEQLGVLRSAFSALAPGGLLALDLPNPHLEMEGRPNGACLLEGTHYTPEGTIQEWSVTESDPAGQRLRVTSLYDRIGADGLMRRDSLAVDLRLYYRYELDLLLQTAGLAVEAMLGDYDYSEYHSSAPRLLALARRPLS